MNAIPKTTPFIGEEDYLALEHQADGKHEYVDGEIYAMAEASKNHQSITDNVLGEIRQHLKNTPCRPFRSAVKIKTDTAFFYPDVMVVCDDKTDHPYYTKQAAVAT